MSDNLDGHAGSMSLIGSRTLHRNTKDILDHLQQTGEPVVVMRYGRPAAALVPIDEQEATTLLLASSPALRERRAARAEFPDSESIPFAVAGREIDDTPSAETDEAAAADVSEETQRLMQIAVQRLMDETSLASHRIANQELDVDVSQNASLLAGRRRTALAIIDLLDGIREQTVALSASGLTEAHTHGQATGEVDAALG